MKDEKLWEYLACDRLSQKRSSHPCCKQCGILSVSLVCHCTFRQSPIPSGSEPVLRGACAAGKLTSSSKFGCARRHFRCSRFRHKPGAFAAQRKIGDTGHEQLKSHSSTCVSEREKRKDASILALHVDDEVRRGPEEHLMRDFERMTPVFVSRKF